MVTIVSVHTLCLKTFRTPVIFLPCDAMRCTIFVIVILSVRLSVTVVDCVHTVRPTITISSPYGSPMILVFRDTCIRFIPKFEGSHPNMDEILCRTVFLRSFNVLVCVDSINFFIV